MVEVKLDVYSLPHVVAFIYPLEAPIGLPNQDSITYP
jgi:hypothetical protein